MLPQIRSIEDCWPYMTIKTNYLQRETMSNIEIQLRDDSLSLPLEEESTAAPHDSIGGNGKQHIKKKQWIKKREIS